jgi:hypothetical protein
MSDPRASRVNGYRVWLRRGDQATVHFEGTLRLGTAEYEPIAALLGGVLEPRKPPAITLRMTELVFLNSSGINTLYKFVDSDPQARRRRRARRGLVDDHLAGQVACRTCANSCPRSP